MSREMIPWCWTNFLAPFCQLSMSIPSTKPLTSSMIERNPWLCICSLKTKRQRRDSQRRLPVEACSSMSVLWIWMWNICHSAELDIVEWELIMERYYIIRYFQVLFKFTYNIWYFLIVWFRHLHPLQGHVYQRFRLAWWEDRFSQISTLQWFKDPSVDLPDEKSKATWIGSSGSGGQFHVGCFGYWSGHGHWIGNVYKAIYVNLCQMIFYLEMEYKLI